MFKSAVQGNIISQTIINGIIAIGSGRLDMNK